MVIDAFGQGTGEEAVATFDTARPCSGDGLALAALVRAGDPAGGRAYQWCKHALDVTLATLLLLLLLPLLLAITVGIWLTCGRPSLFRQVRIGRGGRPFVMYKFRTMRPDRRKRAEPYAGPDRRRTHKSPHDPRVTRLGRFLRRTSLDELPQLLNVLTGDMSLVGPRPELPEIVARYAPWQHQRHLVRPGITGWWQVQGRSHRPMHEHTELDLYYVAHRSVMLDVWILLRTLPAVLGRRDAF